MIQRPCIQLALLLSLGNHAMAENVAETVLQMKQQDSGAYYVRGVFADQLATEMLVDTGSSYVVLTSKMFKKLERAGNARYRRTIRGKTAAGRTMEAKVYALDNLALGSDCILQGVEAVVLPGSDRNILGLSALRRLQPFSMDFDPPTLRFASCDAPDPDATTLSAGVAAPAPR